jgi:hypothetical protein
MLKLRKAPLGHGIFFKWFYKVGLIQSFFLIQNKKQTRIYGIIIHLDTGIYKFIKFMSIMGQLELVRIET